MNEELVGSLFKRHKWAYPISNDFPTYCLVNSEHGDGYYELLNNLFRDLESIYQGKTPEVVIHNLHLDCWGLLIEAITNSNKAHDLIAKAMRDSQTICQVCGDEGRIVNKDNLFPILCPPCDSQGSEEEPLDYWLLDPIFAEETT